MASRLTFSNRTGWLMALPGFGLICLFVILPFVLAFALSFTNQRLVSPNPTEWVGLASYRSLLSVGVLHLDPLRDEAGEVVTDAEGEPEYPRLREFTRNNPEHPRLDGMREWFSFDWRGGRTFVLATDVVFMTAVVNTLVFVGPSGCGKSTSLRMIAGLEDITDGTLEIGGRVVNDLPPKDRGVAMVFQSYAIVPHMTVRENVAFGLTIAGAPRAEKDQKAAEAARILQMEHLLDRRPSQRSGGQRQRVAIGWAIVRNPSVFLFDEPLSNLDAALRMDMRFEIGKLPQQLKATMIYVSHDQVEAMTLADKIVVLKDGQVMQVGSPMELYHNSANAFVAGFIGSPSMNVLDVEVRAVQGDRVVVANAALDPVEVRPRVGTYAPGLRARLGVRPQDLTPLLAEAGPGVGRLHGTIAPTERLEAETIVEATLTDRNRVIASMARDAVYEVGSPVTLSFHPEEAHLFPA